MNLDNKRIRSENWLVKNGKYFNISAIDRKVKAHGKISRFLSEGRKLSDQDINKIFRFLKKFEKCKMRIEFLRDDTEFWLKEYKPLIKKSSIDKELNLNEAVRHFLYSNRRINDERIRSLSILIKKILQF